MPALNFKLQFAEAVRNKTKRQTIRKLRVVPIRLGDTLYLYTGMRTKSCEKIGETFCRAAVPILIDGPIIKLAGRELPIKERSALAVNDGFLDALEMCAFFSPGLEGQLIIW